MRRTTLFAATLALAWNVAACSPTPVEVKTGGADHGAVATRKTFSFGTLPATMNGFAEGDITAEVNQRAKAEVVTALKSKGYEEAADGELTVYIASGTRRVLEDRSVAVMRMGATEAADTQHGLALDIMEKGSRTPLYHSDVRYDADVKKVEPEKVRKAVEELVSKVPPAGAN